ncbi:PAS domain S-box protein [Bacillus salitolerans]|uniref:histidine kinase n=1 Tax=Bacillus salitolerans TaxID=1437434 RepID=A0ABW4LMY4_9BACI
MNTNFTDDLRDALFVLDNNWNFIYINQAGEELLSRKKADLIGKLVWDEFEETVDSTFFHQYHRAVNEGITVEFEEYYPPLNEWFDVRAYPNNEGLVVHFRSISKAKKALLKTEQHYESLFTFHPDAVYSFDLNGNYLSVNKSFEKLFGYSKQEALKMDYRILLSTEDKESVDYFFQQASRGYPQSYEVTCLTKDGDQVEVAVTNLPIVVDQEIIGVYGIAKDITDRKLIEQERQEREARLNQALTIAKLISWELELKNNYFYWEDNVSTIIGRQLKVTKLKFLDFLQIVEETDIEKVKDHFTRATEGESLNCQCRIRLDNGDIRFVEITGETLVNEEGRITKIVGIIKDVTERKKEQEQLEKSEELYRVISENSQDVITYSSPDGTLTYLSPAIRSLLGYEVDELLGRRGIEFVHPEDKKDAEKRLLKDQEVITVRYKHKEGHYVWIERSSKLIKNKSGEIEKILAIGRDVTERVRARELMIKSEKLTLAGQLAAGIAHEIRNPLTAIKGFLHLINAGVELKNVYLDVMSSEISRIEAILSELLLLAKPSDLQLKKRELHSILNQVITLLETEANLMDIVFDKKFTSNEIALFCDENQLKQVCINFIKNAIEAMPSGGRVEIRTAVEGERAIISFSDTGCGIPEEQLNKLGQPFFTTKEKGTGLGFAVSNSIIERLNGTIDIASEENVGTTITVRLPVLEDE